MEDLINNVMPTHCLYWPITSEKAFVYATMRIV